MSHAKNRTPSRRPHLLAYFGNLDSTPTLERRLFLHLKKDKFTSKSKLKDNISIHSLTDWP
jgi:hypothetical protein